MSAVKQWAREGASQGWVTVCQLPQGWPTDSSSRRLGFKGGHYEHFPEGGRWSDGGGGSRCINGRLQQQFEVADDIIIIIGVGHIDEPQLGIEFTATPIRRLH